MGSFLMEALKDAGIRISLTTWMAIKIMPEQNPKTTWNAVLLGTTDDARALAQKKNKVY